MRYSETLVKTCTARVLDLPTHSRETRKVRGKEGWRGKRGQGRGETKTFGLNCRSGQQKFLWYVFIAWLRWQKHHGVIKKQNKNNNNLFLVTSVVALLQAEVFTESKVRGQQRFNTLVQARHSSWEF